MGQELKKAKIKDSGKEIQVYRSAVRSTWIDYEDCKTEYYTNMLEFMD